MAKLTITEAEHQKVVIEWVRLHEKKWPCLKYLYACPNEGKHKVQYRVHQKAMGVKKGVLDLFLPFPTFDHSGNSPRWTYCGLYIEMKAGKNKLTPEQEDWVAYLRTVGYKVVVCWTSREAMIAIETYLAEAYK